MADWDVVSTAKAPAADPWAVVSHAPAAPAAPANTHKPQTFGNTLLGEGEVAGAGLLNIPGAALNAAIDLGSRVTGNGPREHVIPSVPVGEAGRNLIHNVSDRLPQNSGVSDAELAANNTTRNEFEAQNKRPISESFPDTFAGDVVRNATPVAGDVANIVPAASLVKAGAGVVAGRAAAREAAAFTGGPPNPINEVHAAGYKFRPSDVQARNPTMADVPGSTREAITSSPEQTQGIVRHNSALSTRLIGDEIGVPDATKLTPEHYSEAMKVPGADYDRLGAGVGTVEKPLTGAPDTLRGMADDQSVQAMPAAARAQARRIAQGLESGQYSGTQLPKDISYFRGITGGQAAADALEEEFGAQIKQKMPGEEGTYEAARTKFAKIYNAQAATTGGLIDAADYRRLAEANPRLLSGNSRIVALAGGELPAVTKLPSAGADVSPVKGTLYDTVANAAARGAAKLGPLNITRPGLQAKIARAAPATGPLPSGPLQSGLPAVGQTPLPIGPGGSPAGLAPPPGPVPPRSPVRGPLGQQLAMQGPNADLTPPEGQTPGHRFKGPTGPQAEAELHAPILERPPGNAPGGFSVRGPAGPQLENQGPNADLAPSPGNVGGRTGLRPPPVSLEPPPGSAGAPPPAAPNQLGLALSQAPEVPLKPAEAAAPPPSPKAKPEGGDAATERLFEEAVARDAERAHAANAANGGKTKGELNATRPKLGDIIGGGSQRGGPSTRGAKPRSATKAWGSGPVGSKDAMEAMDRLQEGEPIESIVKDMTSRGYPQEIVDADLRDIKASTDRGPAPRGRHGE